MHSLELDNNAIRWALVVEVDVPRWPDGEHVFPVVVLPAGVPR
jgi:hypothetical protein